MSPISAGNLVSNIALEPCLFFGRFEGSCFAHNTILEPVPVVETIDF